MRKMLLPMYSIECLFFSNLIGCQQQENRPDSCTFLFPYALCVFFKFSQSWHCRSIFRIFTDRKLLCFRAKPAFVLRSIVGLDCWPSLSVQWCLQFSTTTTRMWQPLILQHADSASDKHHGSEKTLLFTTESSTL